MLGTAIHGFGSGLKERTAQARRYDPYESSNMYIEPSERWYGFSEDSAGEKKSENMWKKYMGGEENDNCPQGRRREGAWK